MDKCKIILVNDKYQEQYLEFVSECIEDVKAKVFAYCIPLSDSNTFDADIRRLLDFHEGIGLPDGWVPASVYWLISENTNKIIGVVTIRPELTDYLRFRGGHISYYIRPSERKKGYATRLLSLALEICKDLKIDKVLVTCAKDNIGSARTIQKNGGVLHSEDIEAGEAFQRYWINIGMKNENDIQSAIDRFYEILSGKAGEERNWNEFRSLFLSSDSSLAPMKYNADKICITQRFDVEAYIANLNKFLISNDFYEYGLNYEIKVMDNIAHVYSEYKAKRKKEDKDIIKQGTNLIQLVHDGQAWKIHSMLWQDKAL